MTKIIDIINGSHKPFASFEIVPPLKGNDAARLYAAIEPLMQFAPPFINVTCHRDEVEYIDNGDGTYSRLTLAKRPSTLAITAAIMSHFDVEVVPHVICGGASKTKIESELLDLNFMGIDNVVALRGDAMTGQKFFQPEPDGFAHSDELVAMIARLNRGEYLDPNVKNGISTDFCVGVGAYPEKHYEAANLETDIAHLKAKVDAGAHYVITQMFFDNSRYYDFVRRCRVAGITVPVIPGLKPLSTLRQLELLPRSFHIDLPHDLVTAILQAPDPAAVYEVGIEWCIAQSRDLLAHGVPAIHYYTMCKARNVTAVVQTVF